MRNTALTLSLVVLLAGSANAALVVDLSAASGTDTTVDGAVVTTWSDGTTTFTRSGLNARYVADSGGGIPAIDFDRSAPFLGDITTANGGATIGDATVLIWANFDGYSHPAGSSSYFFSIDGTGNEHTLGRDEDAGGPDALYMWDGGGATYGNQSPGGWVLYIARYYGASISGVTSAEAWMDPVGNGAVVTGPADLTNSDSTAHSGKANSVRVGTWTNGGSGLDGRIRALRIYNTILSDAEVKAAAGQITGVTPRRGTVLLICGRADGPSTPGFSLDRALTAVDTAASDWWSQRSCISCHTAGAYLIAPGDARRELPSWNTVYAGAQSVAAAWDSGEQIEWLVATACFLAIADAEDGGGLQPGTVAALDRALSLQDEAGHWPTWLKCTWPPYESDDHFSVTLMAVALGMAGPDYAATTPATNGMARIRNYLMANPPVTLHHKAMLLWADTFHDDLVSDVNETQWIDELWAEQRADGGWFAVDLGPFDLGGLDTGPPPVEQSDGFGTGFALFILRTAGVNAMDPRIQNGVAWLKANQDVDGRWFTHSLRNRSGTPHYITNVGTVFAIKALYLCGEADQSSAGTLICRR